MYGPKRLLTSRAGAAVSLLVEKMPSPGPDNPQVCTTLYL